MPMLTEKLGSWVSEQFVGFAKVMLWWVSLVDMAVEEIFVTPSGAQNRWTKSNNVNWLDERDLDSSGNADEVRQRVAASMARPEGAHRVVSERIGGKEMVVNLVKSLYSVVTLAMTEEVSNDTVHELRFAIKRFMTDFEMMDASLRPTRVKPMWVTTYNIAGLQNIIMEMWLMGPLRNFWEGSFRGEAYFKYMKAVIVMGLRKNWQQNTLKRMLKKRALSILLEEEWEDTQDSDSDDDDFVDLVEEETVDESQETRWHQVENSDFASYSTHEQAVTLAKDYHCISAVVIEGGGIMIVSNNRSEWTAVQFADTSTNIMLDSLTYGEMYLEDECHEINMEIVTHGCLLLPHLPMRFEKTGSEKRWYTMVRSDWKNWDGDDFVTYTL